MVTARNLVDSTEYGLLAHFLGPRTEEDLPIPVCRLSD
jgi:hypothetical protein